ncbi:hypothetical protein MtrunA17_Chr5g0412081 [Medicago truncatula]|uniref:Bromodomain associated domain-containing protein n=1 Tax=Medicago truncatula TaxID=3880 RepID=G7JWB6_MEDTR|nr:uncharacterized protein LOC11407034 [Medicago truncatula]AES95977.1 hypothetical protein MTR_5g031750 [Medicago truncatula]RHN54918.1 hypothetical protein MtrunA17_Chr5g0412081 [Medicago truncatula]
MSLLGTDGRGYDLARNLETHGVWRKWLGDSNYTNFVPFLSSPSSWDSFMKTDSSKSTLHIHLQLRVRALLFDKAASSISLSSNPNVSKLNPNFLHLHPDDVYFTLDNNNAPSSSNSKVGSRYVDSELPETWYNQVIENYKANKKLVMWDRELSPKRSPAEMASYIMRSSNRKKRRVVFNEEQHQVMDQSNGGNLVDGDDDEFVFPEITYAWNSVPESAIPVTDRVENNNNQKERIVSVLDTLPLVMTRNAEYVNGKHGGGLYRGKLVSEGNEIVLGREQAVKLSQKVVARVLLGAGFEAAMEGPTEYLSEVMSKRIVKIGTNLKVLADSYNQQCSAIDLLKMLLKTVGFSNFAPLVDVVKDDSRNIIQQGQQRPHGIQSQLQQQQQNSLRLPQQVQMQRQMHTQMQQMINPQNLAFQQQQQLHLERLRSQQSTPRPAMDVNKDRQLVKVKLENTSDLPSDSNAFNSIHHQMQFRHQQAAMSNFLPQSNTQFRQMGSPQIPSQNNISMVRAPPVKVEGFSELFGGDSSSKHDSEENRLTSPSSK